MPNNHHQVVTRFAPSPTGDLHIGGARTALFNWLYARKHNGKFLLRIEDTDIDRSTEKAKNSILNGLSWLGLDWDGDPISQRLLVERHKNIIKKLLEEEKAFKCFSTQDEINKVKEKAKQQKTSTIFNSPWRNKKPKDHPDLPYSVRLKSPNENKLEINDEIQGKVIWNNSDLDDMVLLRSDGTPTYMLAVVVDDHDMGITHVIRGDDHLSNAARQVLLYNALGWEIPKFAHIPLIHGEDGQKLSKRHDAQNINEFAKLGYIPSGLLNYLCRLGWSHGNEEIFSIDQAQKWFKLEKIGKGPSKLDTKKMIYVNKQHMGLATPENLILHFKNYLEKNDFTPLNEKQIILLEKSFEFLQPKLKNFSDLQEQIAFIINSNPVKIEDEILASLVRSNRKILEDLTLQLQSVTWNRDKIEKLLIKFAEDNQIKFGELAKPIKGALLGKAKSPSVIDIMNVLGREETLSRIEESKKL